MRRDWMGTMFVGAIVAGIIGLLVPMMRTERPMRRVMRRGRQMMRNGNMGRMMQMGRIMNGRNMQQLYRSGRQVMRSMAR